MLDIFAKDVQDDNLRRLCVITERTIEEELKAAADNSGRNRNVACTPRFNVKQPERPPRASNRRRVYFGADQSQTFAQDHSQIARTVQVRRVHFGADQSKTFTQDGTVLERKMAILLPRHLADSIEHHAPLASPRYMTSEARNVTSEAPLPSPRDMQSPRDMKSPRGGSNPGTPRKDSTPSKSAARGPRTPNTDDDDRASQPARPVEPESWPSGDPGGMFSMFLPWLGGGEAGKVQGGGAPDADGGGLSDSKAGQETVHDEDKFQSDFEKRRSR
ncbi:hypothetical protein T484DRAFT_1824772 [Baffinella frigidus]|nr:hypothetical protein T484DRAFT_1824772 [Cryptophyta sp. CCMP2293]